MRQRQHRGKGWLAGTLFSLVVVVAACSGPATKAKVESTTPPTAASSHGTEQPAMDPGHVVPPIAGSSTTTPREVPARPINPVVDAGQQIVITSHGFDPARLYADDSTPVVWTNLSGVPQRVDFVAFPVHSAVIPAGGQFVWTPDGAGLSIAYRSASGFHGILSLQAG